AGDGTRLTPQKKRERGETRRRTAFVIHVEPKSRERGELRDAEARLAEAVGLTRAIGLDVIGEHIVPLARPTPATLIGSGKTDEIAAEARGLEPEVIIVNAQLSPVQ